MPTTRDGELVLKLASLQSELRRQLDRSLSAHGISFTEFVVLFHLRNSEHGSLRRIDLAERVGLSPSGVTRVLNPMEKTGLVKKEVNARDARVSLVGLTRSGEEIYRDAEQSFNHSAERFLEPLEDDARIELATLVDALL